MDTSTTNSGSYLHYNPSRVDYSVSEDELTRLRDVGQNLWKDICLVSFSIGLPCLINAVADTKNPFELTFGVFLNYFFGILGSCLAVVFFLAWQKDRINAENIFSLIKNKPVMKIETANTEGNSKLIKVNGAGDNTPS